MRYPTARTNARLVGTWFSAKRTLHWTDGQSSVASLGGPACWDVMCMRGFCLCVCVRVCVCVCLYVCFLVCINGASLGGPAWWDLCVSHVLGCDVYERFLPVCMCVCVYVCVCV